MPFLIHRWLLFFCIQLLVFKDCQCLFLRHTHSGKCIAAGGIAWNDEWGERHWAEMVDNCLNVSAQFSYSNNELLKNVEKGGTLSCGTGSKYKSRFVLYKGLNSGGKQFEMSTDHNLKQTPAGSINRYKKNICVQPSNINKYIDEKANGCCDSAEQKFTFGSVTGYNTKMERGSCSSIQRMLIKKADYGDFNNGGTFDNDASIDKKCCSLTTCKVKNLCGGKRSCELTVNYDLLSPYCTYHTLKELYTEYTCVDAYDFTGKTEDSTLNVRLSSLPSKGFIEIKNGSTWRKVNDKNWDKERQKMLCKYMGFDENHGNVLDAKELGSKQKIATGDLVCYDTQSSGTSCCINLQISTTATCVDIPYVTCKICNEPLLKNVNTFPDSVFSGNGGASKYEDARFLSNGWCATGYRTEYILIDLQKEYHITQVVTLGDKDQTKWSESYSLKYSHNKTLVDRSKAVQINGNQNGYQASTTILNIYNVRYIKIESTATKDFCLRIELCGRVQQPSSVWGIFVTAFTFSARVSLKLRPAKVSSYIAYFDIYLNGAYLKRISQISRSLNIQNLEIKNLKPNYEYKVGVVAIDGYSQTSRIVEKKFKTKKAVFSGPPVDIVLKSRNKNALDVSWKAPQDENLHAGVVTGYQVCFSSKNSVTKCLALKGPEILSFTISDLQPSTKYFVTVATGTKSGYGNKSLEISEITDREPVSPMSASYYSLAVYIPKEAEYIKEVMVIVQIGTNKTTPSNNIETNALKPYNASMIGDPYVIAYLKADVLPLTFVIGDGKEYNSDNEKYSNRHLNPNLNYILFLRFFESKDSYYSTEWSSSVRTMVKPPVKSHEDSRTSEVSFVTDYHLPLIIVSLCFLLLLGVNKYQRYLLQKYKQPSQQPQTSKQDDQNKRYDQDQESVYSYESVEPNQAIQDCSVYDETTFTNNENIYANDETTYANDETTYANPDEDL